MALLNKLKRLYFHGKLETNLNPPYTLAIIQCNKQFRKNISGYILDSKLDYQEYLKNVFTKVNKPTALLRKLRTILPRPALLTIYKLFIRPHLDCGGTIYDQPYKFISSEVRNDSI